MSGCGPFPRVFSVSSVCFPLRQSSGLSSGISVLQRSSIFLCENRGSVSQISACSHQTIVVLLKTKIKYWQIECTLTMYPPS